MKRRDHLVIVALALAALGSTAALPDVGDQASSARPGVCVDNVPEPGDRRCVFVNLPVRPPNPLP